MHWTLQGLVDPFAVALHKEEAVPNAQQSTANMHAVNLKPSRQTSLLKQCPLEDTVPSILSRQLLNISRVGNTQNYTVQNLL